MTRDRFEFALLNLNPNQWESFEKLASTFLADEYTSLRTLAGTGDRGRDAILWQPEKDPTVVLQFSTTKDWSTKIKTTAKTIRNEFPATQVLVYMTSRRLEPKADDVRTVLRKNYHLFLDIRDANWFLERQNRSRSTEVASAEFSAPIVDPLLSTSSLIDTKIDGLDRRDARAAVVFLAMHWEDETRDKGLTKLSYEALVKAGLRDTDNDNRMSRSAVHTSVCSILQHHDPREVGKYIDSALERLKKRQIRHWEKYDEFCLSLSERQRRTEALVDLELLDKELESELLAHLVHSSTAFNQSTETEGLRDLVPFVHRILGLFLLQRGEAFAQSVAGGGMVYYTVDEIESICAGQLENAPGTIVPTADLIPLVSSTVEEVLVRPSPSTQRYLRALSDGYTLFAFLQQVPDVQRAVQKIFGHGRVWLDTSAALPLLAEILLDEESRSYTRTVRTARQAGMELFVTPGVVRELFHHIQHSRRCQQLGSAWRSRIPFLFSAYLWSGRPGTDFKRWTVEFIGGHQPHDDIVDFLFEVAGIRERSLKPEVERAEEGLRWQISNYWREVHLARSLASDGSRDPEIAEILAQNDVENFLGIVVARENENKASSLGYEHWWLTLDRGAYRATAEICEQEGLELFDSPVMSYDFLINYFALGPRRGDVTKRDERLLPLMLDMSLLDGVPEDILQIAETTRDQMAGSSERLIRRTIRDHLNQAKLQRGPIARAGIDAIERDLRDAFRKK